MHGSFVKLGIKMLRLRLDVQNMMSTEMSQYHIEAPLTTAV
jgi:hypothetical protein